MSVLPAVEETRSAELIVPQHANHYGTLFGPNGLHMLGKAAFVAATRFAGCPVVMARAEEAVFHRPVRVGAIVDIRARVLSRGRASMRVSAEIYEDGVAAPAVSGMFVMVAVNAAGRPVSIPNAASGQSPEEEAAP